LPSKRYIFGATIIPAGQTLWAGCFDQKE